MQLSGDCGHQGKNRPTGAPFIALLGSIFLLAGACSTKSESEAEKDADDEIDGDSAEATSGGRSGEEPNGSGASSAESGGSGGGNGSGGDGDAVPGPGALPVPEVTGDAQSAGATMTFTDIGAAGWYPSRRDPSSGECDAIDNGACCMTTHEISSDTLSPWDEELMMQLRGPLLLERYAVFQPAPGDPGVWDRVGIWDRAGAVPTAGLSFGADGVEGAGLSGGEFQGTVGSTCVIDVMAEATVPCGAGSVPYCEGEAKQAGFSGSKLFVLLASMPRMDDPAVEAIEHCAGAENNWYDAPWIGLSHAELVRSGKFGSCHCYAKNPDEWWLADGCGQFNVWEVVNDNNEYANFELFSTNFFAYHGYVGEGPCGVNCDVAGLPSSVDLINKSDSAAATSAATASPETGPGKAFRRPSAGYRYFIVLLDVPSRTVQLAMIHPEEIPESVGALLPGLPEWISSGVISQVRDLRLPQ